MKIDEFNDSSDDESIVEKDPYGNGKSILERFKIKASVTSKRLKKFISNNEIFDKTAESHQFLLKNPAVNGKKKPGAKNRSPSHYPAPLAKVKDSLDAVPSGSSDTKKNDTIIPSFRGLKWSKNMSKKDLFFATRASWKGQNHFSSMAFKWSKTEITNLTIHQCLNDNDFLQRYKNYNIHDYFKETLLEDDISGLVDAVTQIKSLFKLAESIKKPFSEWKQYFLNIRNAKGLEKEKEISLKEILSYIYVNDYSEFQEVFSKLPDTIKKMKSSDQHVDALKTFLEDLLSRKLALKGIPYLSEGQIPRHALLYAFGVKEYSDNTVEPSQIPFYSADGVPEKGRVYLGKLMVSSNPQTLFSSDNKATLIPDFDKKFGGSIIAKTIIGEKEIQHIGANLQGSIEKSINLKLPKFNHKDMPARYTAKYGLSKDLYNNFKDTFVLLNKKAQHGKLSWLYMETVLLAHLIEFHEIQLFRYCDTMAQAVGKKINWYDREGAVIESPFKDEMTCTAGRK